MRSVIQFISKRIWKEEFEYYSNKTVYQLCADIQRVIDKRDKGINLDGKFSSETEFRLYPFWQFALIRNYEREAAYIDGKVYEDENGLTRVKFTARPNSVYLILFVVFAVMGTMGAPFVLMSNEPHKLEAAVVSLVMAVIAPVALVVIGAATKVDIKQRFVSALHLKEVNPV